VEDLTVRLRTRALLSAAPALATTVVTAPFARAAQMAPLQQGAPQSLPLLNDLVSSIDLVAPTDSTSIASAYDAIPSLDTSVIYFTAFGRHGAGVFRVAAAGGAPEPVAVGAPFVVPQGVSMSADGQRLFIADAGPTTGGGQAGGVYGLPIGGGTPVPLPGTEGTGARGLEATAEGGAEVVYFTGTDPADGQPALWRIGAAGGTRSVVYKGAPLVEPVGVAVGRDGTVYVADQNASGGELGSVFRILGGAIETIAAGVRTGTPAGLALTPDESALLVSALHPQNGTARVLVIQLPSLTLGIIDAVVGLRHGAGGIHRSRQPHAHAWADSTPGGGAVFRVVTRT
jgi:DNA-binding beta-propeller fold protein YncE